MPVNFLNFVNLNFFAACSPFNRASLFNVPDFRGREKTNVFNDFISSKARNKNLLNIKSL